MNHLQEQTSSRCSNVDFELTRVDYGEDFTTYEIFECQETLIKWAWEVAVASGFSLVVKRSDVFGTRKNERVLLSCDRERIYKNRNVKAQDKAGTRSTWSKKCGCPFLLKGKKLSNTAWFAVVCGIHNHFLAENLKGHSFTDRLSKKIRELGYRLVEDSCSVKRHFETKNNLNVCTLRTIYNQGISLKSWSMSEGHKCINYWRTFPNTHILRFTDVVSIQILWKIYFGLIRLALICCMHFPGLDNGLHIQDQHV